MVEEQLLLAPILSLDCSAWGRDVGLISFVDYDSVEKETSWSFYSGEYEVLGLRGWFLPFLYNFAFNVLGVEKVKADAS